MEIGVQLMALKPPAEGNGEGNMRMAMGIRDSQEGDTHKLGLDLGLETNKKRGREKGKKSEGRREACGWRSQLVSCFGCGAANQDGDQEVEKEQVKTEQGQNDKLGLYASRQDKKNYKEKQKRGQRGGGAPPMAVIMTEEERLSRREESRKANKAYLQKFLKIVKDDRMRQAKQAYRRIQQSRRVVEANKEWSTLPLKSEEARKKVTFHKVHLCDVWYYEEEAVPSQRCLKWMRILDEMRQNKMERAAQEQEKEEKLLRSREEGQCALLRQKAPANHSDPYKALLVFVVLIGYLVYLWHCSQKRRVFRK